jgi:hypothetical protein
VFGDSWKRDAELIAVRDCFQSRTMQASGSGCFVPATARMRPRDSVTNKSDKWSHQIETRLLAVNDLKNPHIEIKNAPARPRVEIPQPLLKATITEVMMAPKADDDATANFRKMLDDNGLPMCR